MIKWSSALPDLLPQPSTVQGAAQTQKIPAQPNPTPHNGPNDAHTPTPTSRAQPLFCVRRRPAPRSQRSPCTREATAATPSD